MPNLKTTIRWQRYEPALPGNREDKRPFYFEIAADLTKEQYRALQDELAKVDEHPAPPDGETAVAAEERRRAEALESAKRTAKALGPFVRFGAEPLTLDGEQVTTLEQYLVAMLRFQDLSFFAEVTSAVSRVNSLGGVQGFFSERLSGGFGSTGQKPNGVRAAAR